MAENTKIQWATHTWNPWIGCSKVNAGCTNCYAEADFAIRKKRVVWGVNGTRVKTSAEYWKKPLAWNRKAKESGERVRVFPSLCDPWENWGGDILNHHGDVLRRCGAEPERYVPESVDWDSLTDLERENLQNGLFRRITMDDLRRDMFDLIDATPSLDYLLLTKRPENLWRMWEPYTLKPLPDRTVGSCVPRHPQYRDNVWLLYSASDQETLETGLPHLLRCYERVPVLGLSLEPLLGPINLRLDDCWIPDDHADLGERLKWIIIGGESGPNARKCEVRWIRDIVRQCKGAGISCFVKQLGSNPVVPNDYHPHPSHWSGMRADPRGCEDGIAKVLLNHHKGGDPSEFPEDLQVQEFPTTCHTN